MKQTIITSVDSLDAAVADAVRLKIKLTAAKAARDAEVAAVEKRHQAEIMRLQEQIAEIEGPVAAFCAANRSAIFPDKKSRETPLAVFGFELTPPRVETANRKIKWGDVIERLKRTRWGQVYLRSKVSVDKESLLADRDKLSVEQCTAVGVQFCQDEQFFMRPKLETATATE